jgi:hypothetical protein
VAGAVNTDFLFYLCDLCPNYVSEFLQPTENIKAFLGIQNLPRKWNNGIVERWNIGFLKDIIHFNSIINPAGGETINLSEA